MVQRAELLPGWLRRRRISPKAKRLIAAALQRRRAVQDAPPVSEPPRASATIIPFPRRQSP